MAVTIDEERCLGCGSCIEGCTSGALEYGDKEPDSYAKVVVNAACMECGDCVDYCANEVLSV